MGNILLIQTFVFPTTLFKDMDWGCRASDHPETLQGLVHTRCSTNIYTELNCIFLKEKPVPGN